MILLLEDDTAFSNAVVTKLRTLLPSTMVYPVYNIPSAKDIVEKYKNKINCYIIDLNMRTNGLNFLRTAKEEIQEMTRYGRISGFLWFEQFVLSQNNKKEILKKALFVTAYEQELLEHLKSKYNTSGLTVEDMIENVLSKESIQINPNQLYEKVKNIIDIT